jgi:hypothetical protein
MEQIEYSETSAYKIQTPGNYPEENTTFLSSVFLIAYAALKEPSQAVSDEPYSEVGKIVTDGFEFCVE